MVKRAQSSRYLACFVCRSYWAFEHFGLNFDQRGFLSTFTAQSVRIFIAHQMYSVFLWSICLFTQCIRNPHFRIFYFK